MDFIADMTRELSGLSDQRLPKIEVRVGSVPEFIKAVEKQIGPLVSDPKLDIASASFCGIRVIEDWKLPKHTAAILQNGELVNVIRFGGEQAKAV
jgi:hypothetical protein